MLRIHYLIFACKGEPAESIERCVLLDPEQGYILKTYESWKLRMGIQEEYQRFLSAAKRRTYILGGKLLSLPCLSPIPTQIRN